MPESMISALSGVSVVVIGSSIAMVASGPMPGSTPIKVPSATPMKQTSSDAGVTACCRPRAIPLQISMDRGPSAPAPELRAEQLDRQADAEAEDRDAEDRHAADDQRAARSRHLAAGEHPDGDGDQQRRHQAEGPHRQSE